MNICDLDCPMSSFKTPAVEFFFPRATGEVEALIFTKDRAAGWAFKLSVVDLVGRHFSQELRWVGQVFRVREPVNHGRLAYRTAVGSASSPA